MTQEPLYFVTSSVRNGRTPYSVSRLEPEVVAEADDWPRGWGTEDMGYHAIRPRVSPEEERLSVEKVLTFTGRMVMPVVSLSLTFMIALLFGAEPNYLFDAFSGTPGAALPSTWLTDGHFLICLSFLMIALTNRAFGAAFTAAQVAITWVLMAGIVLWFGTDIAATFAIEPVPTVWGNLGFITALIAGQMISIVVFDLTRGPRWWTAPLWGTALGSIAFVGIYYWLFADATADWSTRAGYDLGVKLLMAGLMLVPYYMMRKSIRPLPGYGGA